MFRFHCRVCIVNFQWTYMKPRKSYLRNKTVRSKGVLVYALSLLTIRQQTFRRISSVSYVQREIKFVTPDLIIDCCINLHFMLEM